MPKTEPRFLGLYSCRAYRTMTRIKAWETWNSVQWSNGRKPSCVVQCICFKLDFTLRLLLPTFHNRWKCEIPKRNLGKVLTTYSNSYLVLSVLHTWHPAFASYNLCVLHPIYLIPSLGFCRLTGKKKTSPCLPPFHLPASFSILSTVSRTPSPPRPDPSSLHLINSSDTVSHWYSLITMPMVHHHSISP